MIALINLKDCRRTVMHFCSMYIATIIRMMKLTTGCYYDIVSKLNTEHRYKN